MRKEPENYDAAAGLTIKIAVAVIFTGLALFAVGSAVGFNAGIWAALDKQIAQAE